MCGNGQRGTKSLYSELDVISPWNRTFCINVPSSRIGEWSGSDDNMKVK